MDCMLVKILINIGMSFLIPKHQNDWMFIFLQPLLSDLEHV